MFSFLERFYILWLIFFFWYQGSTVIRNAVIFTWLLHLCVHENSQEWLFWMQNSRVANEEIDRSCAEKGSK